MDLAAVVKPRMKSPVPKEIKYVGFAGLIILVVLVFFFFNSKEENDHSRTIPAEKRSEAPKVSKTELYTLDPSMRDSSIMKEKPSLEERLKAILIDRVDFENTPFRMAIDYLVSESKKSDPEGVKIDTTQVLSSLESNQMVVTLSLKNVDLLTAIKYLITITDLKYEIQGDAIVLMTAAEKKPESADDFLKAFFMIQEAQVAEKDGKTALALEKFQAAEIALRGIRDADPSWNANIVGYRLKLCREHIGSLGGKIDPESPGGTNF